MNDTPRQNMPALQSGGSARAIVPQDFDSAYRIANAVVVAGMAPRGLDTPEKATIAILHGLEVGMTPMAALQSIAIVNGRPTIWGDGALGLVQGSGKMESHKEWFEGEGDTRKAFCTVKRKGDPEEKKGEFSVSDAKKANLWGKSGPWQQYPDRMLKMRARGFALRDGFSDVLRGLGIAEEVQDYEEMRDITPAKPAAKQPPMPPSTTAEPQIDVPYKDRPSRYEQEPAAEARSDVADADGVVIDGDAAPEVAYAPEEGYDGDDDTEFFQRLEDAMAEAKDAADVEEVFTNFDPLARFTGADNGDTNMSISLAIKNRRLKELRTK